MQANGTIENIKKIGKQMKKACPVEIQLSHAHTGLARALGFADWHSLTVDLQNPSSKLFNNRIEKLSSDPEHPTFIAAVERFSQSKGVQLDITYTLFVEILPIALERWRIWGLGKRTVPCRWLIQFKSTV